MASSFSSPLAAYRQPTFRYGMLVALLALLAVSIVWWSPDSERALLLHLAQLVTVVVLLVNHILFAFVDVAVQRRYRTAHLLFVAIGLGTVITLSVASRRATAEPDRAAAASAVTAASASSLPSSREQ